MSYYRPPDHGDAEPAPDGLLAPGYPPTPFAPLPPGDRVDAQPGPLARTSSDASIETEIEPPGEVVEEIWSVVATEDAARAADVVGEHLQDAGLETWVRPWNDLQLSTGLIRVYEVLVREADEARALALIDEATAAGDWPLPAHVPEIDESGDGCRRVMIVGMCVLLAAIVIGVIWFSLG